jgi:hypothetical protein
MKLETAAFGYLRERLILRTAGQRPLAIRDIRRVSPASDGLMFCNALAGAFVPDF